MTLNTLNIDVTRGLAPPPLIFSDVAQVAGSACEAAGAKATTNSELRITGRGGIALSPTVPLPARGGSSDWVSLEMIPEVPVGIALPSGKTITLEPGETYQVQATCVNSWKAEQRSFFLNSSDKKEG